MTTKKKQQSGPPSATIPQSVYKPTTTQPKTYTTTPPVPANRKPGAAPPTTVRPASVGAVRQPSASPRSSAGRPQGYNPRGVQGSSTQLGAAPYMGGGHAPAAVTQAQIQNAYNARTQPAPVVAIPRSAPRYTPVSQTPANRGAALRQQAQIAARTGDYQTAATQLVQSYGTGDFYGGALPAGLVSTGVGERRPIAVANPYGYNPAVTGPYQSGVPSQLVVTGIDGYGGERRPAENSDPWAPAPQPPAWTNVAPAVDPVETYRQQIMQRAAVNDAGMSQKWLQPATPLAGNPMSQPRSMQEFMAALTPAQLASPEVQSLLETLLNDPYA